MSPKISVIIPTHHRNAQLAVCLGRLAPGAQTLDPSQYEVIVSDDGSESTAQSMISEQFPWARWVPGPRQGPAANRNSGARHALGEFIAFTDDDCLPAPHWLAAYASAISPQVDLLEGKTTCDQGLTSCLDEAPVNLTGGNFWSCNLCYRKSAFDRLGGFDEDFGFWCEDMELGGRARRNGFVWRFVADAVVDHPRRRRPGGWKLGLRWEARVLLWFKEGQRGSVALRLPLHMLKYRVAQFVHEPFKRDALRALFASAGEFACIVVHLPQWRRKYKSVAPR